ncbi:MAG TPA: glycosyltransferase family 2 protein, partial [Bacteroidia bacterium]|nr:glycosyltransferase family 2 protein [Bacteroidia bacterium]
MSYACRLNSFFEEQHCCVLIPTYNNQKTLEKVITDTLEYTNHIVVVNDGSTDTTPQIVAKFKDEVSVVNFPVNCGKGLALREGFKFALSKNYQYAISIDSDGQHYPEDLEKFLIKIKEQPNSLIIGARNMEQASVPGKSSFGNKFSNFWFELETGIKMPDTQSGYRLYPIEKLKNISFYTTRFEFEIEVIVKAAWAGIPVIPLPVGVFYPTKEERVSHF